MSVKPSWILKFSDLERSREVFGEVNILDGLSVESNLGFEKVLLDLSVQIHLGEWPDQGSLNQFPALKFALEMAETDWNQQGEFVLFPSEFTLGNTRLPINGLVWMDTVEVMAEQALAKIQSGYNCVKLKIGAYDFELEYELLKSLRKSFGPEELTLRVDANGAFSGKDPLEKLKRLGDLQLHSIEQPIMPGHRDEMAHLCSKSPVPIALDEELIGHLGADEKKDLLNQINPTYIILKPALIGGTGEANEWVQIAQEKGIGWWATSALESNIGLNAIAQWTATKPISVPHGLGTGLLYSNNFECPLTVAGGFLDYQPGKTWNLSKLSPKEWN